MSQQSLAPYTYKVVVLGASGAGKTAFLATMFHEFSIANSLKFNLLATTAEDYEKLNLIYRSLFEGKWPVGTVGISELKLSCLIKSLYYVMQITYLDYAGGKLLKPGSSEYQMLLKHVKEADALLVILDGEKILKLMQEEKNGDELFYNDLTYVFQCSAYSNAPIHFVITKWDILDPAYSLQSIKDRLLANRDFEEVISAQDHRIVRLIPVSAVGKQFAKLVANGVMEIIPGGKLNPINVKVPVACVLVDQFSNKVMQKIDEFRDGLQLPPFIVRRIPWRFLVMLTGGMAQFLQNIPTHPLLLIGSTIALDRLLDWIGHLHESTEKKQRRFEQIRKERENSIKTIENLQQAVNHAAVCCMYLVKEFERDFPGSFLP